MCAMEDSFQVFIELNIWLYKTHDKTQNGHARKLLGAIPQVEVRAPLHQDHRGDGREQVNDVLEHRFNRLGQELLAEEDRDGDAHDAREHQRQQRTVERAEDMRPEPILFMRRRPCAGEDQVQAVGGKGAPVEKRLYTSTTLTNTMYYIGETFFDWGPVSLTNRH